MMRDFFKIFSRFLANDIKNKQIFGGSQRRFYRIFDRDKSYIILEDENSDRLVRYAKLLQNLLHYGIPVPDVYAVDESRSVGMILMEDIGSLSLFDWYRRTGDIEPHFRAAKILAKIHRLGDVPGRVEYDFDIPDLLYETQYFVRHFLVGYCGYPEGVGDALMDEFYRLAKFAAYSPKGLMHRDFQSQNIFITRGNVCIVDFQGARRGFPAYDLASLIEDPYLNLPESISRMIMSEYFSNANFNNYEREMFLDSYPYIALQRLLQATAAYAYLSTIQEKWWFERFIIPALERTSKWLYIIDDFPILKDVLTSVMKTIKLKKCVDKCDEDD
ncbi:phosphotransferase [bacterium]|nr:phosphotransferase [bacterium]